MVSSAGWETDICCNFGIEDITEDCTVYKINRLLTEDDVAFFEEITKEEGK